MNLNHANLARLLISIAACELVGLIAGIFSSMGIYPWYDNLSKPSLTPPNWVFAPVWSTLYLLMGVSFYIIWNYLYKETDKHKVKLAMIIFGVQLLLNFLWSYVFFGQQSIFGGMIVIVLLWFAIISTIISFFPISRIAAILLIPYILWVSFAAYLNIGLMQLNNY